MINHIPIRRPLCLVGLLYAAAALFAVTCRAGAAPTFAQLDRERVVLAGFVEYKEYRTSQGGDRSVLSLSDTAILGESQAAILEQFLSDSEMLPRHRLHKFWKENRDNLRREDAAGIEGVLCYMEEDSLPEMGSLVLLEGDFLAFMHATNPGEFDAADYYRIAGQQGRVMKCRCLAQSRTGDAFREKLYGIREYLSLLTDACYGGRDACVMKAMLLGEKGTLERDVKELYRQNGIIHILAISGLHLSIIGMGCHKLLMKIRCPRAVNIIFCTGLMYCYGVMTGMGISMFRAYIMFTLHLLSGLIGRTYDLLTAVSVAALAALVQQPLYIQHSGFLFSFGAVCGIGVFLPAAMTNLFGQGRAEKALAGGIAISVCTLPVYLSFYYEFPPYSVLLNLIVIPCMSLVLPGGLISLLAAACFLPLGEAAAYPVRLFLRFYEMCCQLCMKLPEGRWVTGCPKPWQTAVFLGILIALVVWNHRLSRLQFWQGVLCALLALTVRAPQGLQITMLDVGQGDCIYLSQENGVHMLIDGGSSDKSDTAAYQIIPYLKYEGASRLDAIVVTHPDSDHINGISAMLQTAHKDGISIGTLYLPDVGARARNEEYRMLEELAGEADIPVRYLGRGDRLRYRDIMLTCIHPQKGWDTEETNAYSTVLYLTYGDFTALFTGDLEGEGERQVADALRLQKSAAYGTAGQSLSEDGGQDGAARADWDIHDITLLKVAHHGSKNSTGEAFLQAVNPKLALISSGQDNRYGHPHEELITRLKGHGCIVYGTQEKGAVTVYVRNGKVRVEGFLER